MKKATLQDRYYLEVGLCWEKAAFENYNELANIIKNKSAREALRGLAFSEKGHFLLLAEKYQEYFGIDPEFENVGRFTGPLSDGIWSFFRRDKKMASAKKFLKIFNHAIDEEKKAVDLYKKAENETDVFDLKELYSILQSVENNHYLVLREEFQKQFRKSPSSFTL
ncbi:ferritin family protein [Patescibacteria group bacterium]|nr:ferritin family protein [Patescibacteria group bacterium]MBU1673547.1 ferritin family protein [Patescibacteria group bacterium]MBU1963625.1 ferritin family protein [Patescibacteria group bacterium]